MIGRALRAFAFAAALLAPAAAFAAPVQLARVPAVFQNGQVYLKVSLNDAKPVWMAFDTNATSSVLYAAHAARLRVRAGVVVEAVTFRPSASSAACAPDGTVVAGRLGSDWLGDRVAEIRTREHEVWLSAPIPPPPAPIERPIVAASFTD